MKEGKVGGQLRPDQGGQFTADSPIKHAFDKFKLFLDEFEFVNVREADKMIDWKERKLV